MALHLFTQGNESQHQSEHRDSHHEHERGHHCPAPFLPPIHQTIQTMPANVTGPSTIIPRSSTSASLRRRVNREDHPEDQEVLCRLQTYHTRTHLTIVEKTTAAY